MRLSTSFFVILEHRTPDAKGAHRRMHDHPSEVTFTLEKPMNMRTGFIEPAEVFRGICQDALHLGPTWRININATPGVRPTLESLAVVLRERLLSTYPTIQVDINSGDFMVSTR